MLKYIKKVIDFDFLYLFDFNHL